MSAYNIYCSIYKRIEESISTSNHFCHFFNNIIENLKN